ncbi:MULTISPECIES: helix-turn-helix domain-containing protein [Flavobacterium]|uniref:helix-turn-helix domain-containing protein n=1 Tax=Flavobacterium TaxID=237 RepID=UPI00188D61DF|nr:MULTISPECIES: helix-turn-helix domain-containing protein [Flavobacterium]MBF4470764.1 helix-turn-helix domain-containing protein [Flavobacterium sp. HJJ]
MENQNLAQGVKELRKREALSQDELARKAGLSLRTVQRVENGETIPTAETLKRLASVLGVAPNELIEFESEKEVPKIVLKTKHEYVHFFEDKLVFSKTPDINLVADYSKSVTYVFRTLMVFLISIPLFTAMGIYFYTISNIPMAIYGTTFAFMFLTAALNIMLFSSGSPVVSFANITSIKVNSKMSQNILSISFMESGRIKQRGMILEKDQVQPMMDVLLTWNIFDKKDMEMNKKPQILKVIFFCLYILTSSLFVFYNPKQLYLTTYLQSGLLLVICFILIGKMLRNSVFLNRDTIAIANSPIDR